MYNIASRKSCYYHPSSITSRYACIYYNAIIKSTVHKYSKKNENMPTFFNFFYKMCEIFFDIFEIICEILELNKYKAYFRQLYLLFHLYPSI